MNETQQEKLEWLCREIQKGIDSIEAGRVSDGPTAMARIRERLLKQRAEKDRKIREQNEHQP